MTPEQKVAFIQAQTALMLVELEGMKAANAPYISRGEHPIYGEGHFQELSAKYAHLDHNLLVTFFNEGAP